MSKDFYFVKQHGLLWIVYNKIYGPMVPAWIEDSRWESEQKAKEHCRILHVENGCELVAERIPENVWVPDNNAGKK